MADHLITTKPGLTDCNRCHTPVLAATVGGLDRHIDPVTLNVGGMLAALSGGVALFLQRGTLIYTLDPEHVGSGQPLTVLPEHVCGRDVPDRFIDPDHMSAAIALVQLLLGATPVPAEATPPY
jgi:hypothetical protein